MRPKTLRATKRAGIEREIIAVASEQFGLHGFDGFSLRKVAVKMGCAVGTLYLYFDNKEALLHAVVENSFRTLLESLRALPPANSPREMFRNAFRAYVEFGLKHPHHYRCAFAQPSPSPSTKYQPHAAFEFMREKVQAGVRAGLFQSDNAELVSQVIWSSVHGLTSLLIARPEFPWEPRKALIETLSDTMLTGLFHASPKIDGPHA
jgi:AcrR family transcriptional regulator